MILKEEPETKFLIAGDGAQKEVLESQVRDLDISSSVTFLGRVLHEDMPTLLSQADIYVSTSLYDGTSVSLLEALACGAFPVVTDISSNREWIADGDNGFLFPSENENVLAKKIVETIRNRKLLERAYEKNQEIVKQRGYWREYIEKIEEIYNSP